MLIKLDQSSANTLGFMASGKLTDNDYKNFLIPEVKEALSREGKIRLLFQMEAFHGWDMQAAWDDLVFGLEINKDVERVAIVGDQQWEATIAKLMRIFTRGAVRYFDHQQKDAAWEWVRE